MKQTDEQTRENGGALVVVTGAGRGIGFEAASLLAREHGVEVIAVSRDVSAWSSGKGIPRVVPLSADLFTDAGIAAVARAVGERPLAGLINNAGILLKRELGSWTAAELDALYAANARAPLMLVQALLPALRKGASAHVLNISSMGGFQGSVKFPGLIGYSASKAALACITECLAVELAQTSVRCNCLCLGAVDTAMLREAFPGYLAPTDAQTMGGFIAEFLLNGHKLLNGKVLPVSLSTP
jgi:3-oxoacyl-[acyl-carrier protein] reductase